MEEAQAMDGTSRSNTYARTHTAPWYVTTDVQNLPHVVVCQVSGEVDADTAPMLTQALEQEVWRVVCPAQELRVDLSGVARFSAAGLTVLLRLRERAADRRVPLALIAPSRGVRRVLELTDTVRLFTILPAARSTAVSAPGTRG